MIEKLETSAQFIAAQKKCSPKIGIVLGSGLGSYTTHIENATTLPYSKIPHFKGPGVESHAGNLILGSIRDKEVAVLQGRLHAYEGHSMEDVVFPVRVLSRLGIKVLILTNASGGINENFGPGDLVMISDHINLSGQNPLVGPNIPELGPRFPDMTYTYAPDLINLFLQSAAKLNYPLKTGVYSYLLGPTYETPAEIKMLRQLGADMVGMSTVPEAIAANHMEVKIAGISCITNMAAGIIKTKLKHEDIAGVALGALDIFSSLLNETIGSIRI